MIGGVGRARTAPDKQGQMLSDVSTPRPRGRHVTIADGRRMHAILQEPTTGTGEPNAPLVVLEAGAFGFSADWASVQAELAGQGLRSLAYDRAGLGFSDPGPAPRDALAVDADLYRLLDAIGEPGPYIYCGHSMAGLHARLFAARHGDRVTGVVLVDATTPETIDDPGARRALQSFTWLCRAVTAAANAGMVRPLAALGFGNAIGVQGAADAEKRWAFADAAHNLWSTREVEVWAASAYQAMSAGLYPEAVPISAVFAGAPRRRRPRGPRVIRDHAPCPFARVQHEPGANHASLLGPRHAANLARSVVQLSESRRPRAEAPALDTDSTT